MEKNDASVPVLVIFFNRPQALREVFKWVREVKPTQLFLAQDGPRENRPDDMDNILECRKIVENIDWDCELHKNYSEKNLSCDEREFSAISWCFEYVDRLIILEDDCMPSNSFYKLCIELLERYKKDERIHMISGFNRCGIYENYPYDYFFSNTSAGWGWATWRRVWQEIQCLKEKDYWREDFIDLYSKIVDADSLKIYRGILKRASEKRTQDVKANKVISWEYWTGLNMILNNRLAITPTKNMVRYLGLTENSTHSPDRPELTIKRVRRVLTQPAYEIAGPIQHPPFIVRDRLFEQMEHKLFWRGNRTLDSLEGMFLKLKHRYFKLMHYLMKQRGL